MWLFDKLAINWCNSTAIITDERGAVDLETNAFPITEITTREFRTANFELSNGNEWLKSRESLFGDCIANPRYCRDGMSMSLWLSGR